LSAARQAPGSAAARVVTSVPARYRAYEHTLAAPYDALHRRLAAYIPADRLITDPLRLLTWGTDASFYRLVPKIVVVVDNEHEVVRLLVTARRCARPSRSARAARAFPARRSAIRCSCCWGDGWRGADVAPGARTITLQPGVIGAAANRCLAPHGRKIGPDPASIDAAKIGGIAANNASGMCCGTAQNSYHTLAGMRVVLANGTVLDTRDAASRAAFVEREADLVRGLDALARATRADEVLAARIRHKFRMKNTTGYSLNALVDFEDPIEVLAHLMIGSEGTLGFLSEITYETVPDYADKASALILFDDLGAACRAVTLLKGTPVSAVELADRAALRSVEGKPGLPHGIAALGPGGAALLVETRAPDAVTLATQMRAIETTLETLPQIGEVRFSTDPAECARLWNVRKGMFPSVGAMRAVGTTVIIEDVAFPVDRLAEATLALQRLLSEHGYRDAIIFGHALEGNLHFVFTQDFNIAAEVARYRGFMDALCRMVVERYDGSLKAEHGTGRNIAPFVELEWGAAAYAIMRAIKALFDPQGLLNPGVLINDDAEAHLKHLKPLPACDSLVDKCIECGFCEPKCPSHRLTLSPRQRIVGWREIRRLEDQAGSASLEAMRALYDFHGIDTCAACGLCATACPVGIETGLLIKSLRGKRAGRLARTVADVAANHFGAVTRGVRTGLAAADALHGLLGPGPMRSALEAIRSASGGRIPKWSATLPRPAPAPSPRGALPSRASRMVYFPSCATRTMGAQRGDDESDALPAVAERLFGKAGFAVIVPDRLAELCCGQPFESKGLFDAADRKSAELETALQVASDEGRFPIVFDTSPCAYRMKRYLGGRLAVQDSIEFIHDAVLPRVDLARGGAAVAIHPVCSVRKMGLVDKLVAIAQQCSTNVVEADSIPVLRFCR
jgi:D-lactate dehydrogenase